jgi:hypothetical protein
MEFLPYTKVFPYIYVYVYVFFGMEILYFPGY